VAMRSTLILQTRVQLVVHMCVCVGGEEVACPHTSIRWACSTEEAGKEGGHLPTHTHTHTHTHARTHARTQEFPPTWHHYWGTPPAAATARLHPGTRPLPRAWCTAPGPQHLPAQRSEHYIPVHDFSVTPLCTLLLAIAPAAQRKRVSQPYPSLLLTRLNMAKSKSAELRPSISQALHTARYLFIKSKHWAENRV